MMRLPKDVINHVIFPFLNHAEIMQACSIMNIAVPKSTKNPFKATAGVHPVAFDICKKLNGVISGSVLLKCVLNDTWTANDLDVFIDCDEEKLEKKIEKLMLKYHRTLTDLPYIFDMANSVYMSDNKLISAAERVDALEHRNKSPSNLSIGEKLSRLTNIRNLKSVRYIRFDDDSLYVINIINCHDVMCQIYDFDLPICRNYLTADGKFVYAPLDDLTTRKTVFYAKNNIYTGTNLDRCIKYRTRGFKIDFPDYMTFTSDDVRYRFYKNIYKFL